MRGRPRLLPARQTPAGWTDIPRQIAIFAAAYLCYRGVAALATGDRAAALAHARAVIGLERSLHIFAEPAVQAWAARSRPLIDLAGWLYVNAQFTVIIAALLFVYRRHHAAYRPLRDTLLAAMALALPCYALFPTAPPRYLPSFGFSDSVAHATGLSLSPTTAWFSRMANPYAAVPSLHIAFALIVAVMLARLSRRTVVRIAWLAYPLVVAFVVVATGNHFLIDVLLGALAAPAAHGARSACWGLAAPRRRGWRVATAPTAATG